MKSYENSRKRDTNISNIFIRQEITGVYGSELLRDMGEIIDLYDVYENGAEFASNNTNGDYVPADLRYRIAASLIDKEARFLFSKLPDIKVNIPYAAGSPAEKETAKNQMSVIQNYIDKVFKANKFYVNLWKGAKDCFIGKRVAWFVNFNEKTGRVFVDFVPSLEFVAEYDSDEPFKLSKIFTFYNINNVESKSEQRIYKKKYWLENGFCYVSEEIYNGAGEIVETVMEKTKTLFNYIPAGVIINDGLTGDVNGHSDIEDIADYEEYFSKIACSDIDAEGKSMNPIIYMIDMNPTTTEGLSSSAGSIWDLASDGAVQDGAKGNIGKIEPSMTYTNALDSTLDRLKTTMHGVLDIPDISAETLKGTITSGKTLKALYYPLLVRCDEKMLSWKPAIEQIAHCLVDGAKLYPKAAASYTDEPLPDVDFEVIVDNQYPLPDDEESEKQIDMAEVNTDLMARKSYLIKWRGMTPDEADAEIAQIIKEKTMFEAAEAIMPPMDSEV